MFNWDGLFKLRSAPRTFFYALGIGFTESLSYMSTTLILTAYLSAELGFSDKQAGWIYTFYGMASSVVSMLGGFVIDKFGVRATMLFGAFMLSVARLSMALTTNGHVFVTLLVTALPLGSTLTFVTMLTSVKRYTTGESRAFGYSVFYIFLNLGALCGGIFTDAMRHAVGYEKCAHAMAPSLPTGGGSAGGSVALPALPPHKLWTLASDASIDRNLFLTHSAAPIASSFSAFAATSSGVLHSTADSGNRFDASHLFWSAVDADSAAPSAASASSAWSDAAHSHAARSCAAHDAFGGGAQFGGGLVAASAAIGQQWHTRGDNGEELLYSAHSSDSVHEVASSGGAVAAADRHPLLRPPHALFELQSKGSSNSNFRLARGGGAGQPAPKSAAPPSAPTARPKPTKTIWGIPVSDAYRLVLFFGALSTLLIFPTVYFFLPEIAVDEITGEVREFHPTNDSPVGIFTEVVSQTSFWRLTSLIALLIGVKQVHRQLDAALPKYLMRAVGCDASFGTIFAINPFLVIIAIPFTTAIAAASHPFTSIQIGSILVALAPFVFVLFSPSFAVAAAFVVVLSLGEALITPRLNEYAASIAPVGREGTYLALGHSPMFLAKVFSGLSGELLNAYCPCHRSACEPCCVAQLAPGAMPCARGRYLWAVIAGAACVSAVLIFCFRDFLRQSGNGNGGGSGTSDGATSASSTPIASASPYSTVSTLTASSSSGSAHDHVAYHQVDETSGGGHEHWQNALDLLDGDDLDADELHDDDSLRQSSSDSGRHEGIRLGSSRPSHGNAKAAAAAPAVREEEAEYL